MKWRNHKGKRALPWALTIFLRCLLATAPVPANAQGSATPLSDFQSWDEVDVSVRATRILDIAWVTQGRFSSAYPNPAAYLSGVDFKLSAGSHFEFTPSYYFAAFETTSGKKGHFQVPMFSVIMRDASQRDCEKHSMRNGPPKSTTSVRTIEWFNRETLLDLGSRWR